MWLQATACLCCHEHLCFRFVQHLGDKPLAPSVTIDIGCIDEIDSVFDRGVQYTLRVFVRYIAPASANLPGEG